MVYILYDYFFPAYKAGGPIKSLVNLVRSLDSEADLRVICSNRDLDGSELAVKLGTWNTFGNAAVYYAAAGFNDYRKKIPAANNNVFFINGMYSIQYNFLPAIFLKGRKIVSVRGMLHTEAVEQKSFKKEIYLAVWKMLGLHRKCEYHSTSEVETDHIKKRFGKSARVWMIPNLPNVMEHQPLPAKQPGELIMATIALISPMKNHLLVLESLKQCHFPVTYHIYGPVKNESYWDKCKKTISALPANIKVQYHGEIPPDKIAASIAGCHLIVQPSKSENFGHSLLEALMSGRPIVTSRFTPWNNLEEHLAGINVSLDNDQEILKAVNHFAEMNEETLTRWSTAARTYALSAIDVGHLKEQYLQMFAGDNKSVQNH